MKAKKLAKQGKKNNGYIKSLLVLNGIASREIAAELGVSDATISNILKGKRKSKRIQEAIANTLNKDYHELWG